MHGGAARGRARARGPRLEVRLLERVGGRGLVEHPHHQAAREIEPHIAQVLVHRTAACYERVLTAPDGSMRWIEVHLLPHIADDAGGAAQADLLGAFVLISDITRHRLAERAVRDSEERLGKFMQASAEGIVFHQDGFITDANPPVCALTGYALAELMGRKTLEFIALDHVAQAAAVMASGQETAFRSSSSFARCCATAYRCA